MLCSDDFHAPSDEDMANGAFLRDDPVLVCEEWIQLLVQAIILMGQSIMSTRRGEKKKGPRPLGA